MTQQPFRSYFRHRTIGRRATSRSPTTRRATTPPITLPVPSLRLTRRTTPTSSTWRLTNPIATPTPLPPLPMTRRTLPSSKRTSKENSARLIRSQKHPGALLPHHHGQRSLRYNVVGTHRHQARTPDPWINIVLAYMAPCCVLFGCSR